MFRLNEVPLAPRLCTLPRVFFLSPQGFTLRPRPRRNGRGTDRDGLLRRMRHPGGQLCKEQRPTRPTATVAAARHGRVLCMRSAPVCLLDVPGREEGRVAPAAAHLLQTVYTRALVQARQQQQIHHTNSRRSSNKARQALPGPAARSWKKEPAAPPPPPPAPPPPAPPPRLQRAAPAACAGAGGVLPGGTSDSHRKNSQCAPGCPSFTCAPGQHTKTRGLHRPASLH